MPIDDAPRSPWQTRPCSNLFTRGPALLPTSPRPAQTSSLRDPYEPWPLVSLTDPLLMCFVTWTQWIPQIHSWCDTCQSLDESSLFGPLTFSSIGGTRIHATVCYKTELLRLGIKNSATLKIKRVAGRIQKIALRLYYILLNSLC